MLKFEFSDLAFKRTHSYLFVGTLIAAGVIFCITPKTEVSEAEKRKLAQLPSFTLQALGDGSLMRAIDDYIADNFLFRETLTLVAGSIKDLRGTNNDDIQVIVSAHHKSNNPQHEGVDAHQDKASSQDAQSKPASQQPPQPASPTQRDAAAGKSTPGSFSSVASSHSGVENQAGEQSPYQNIESIIIYKGKAVQMFGASPATTAAFVRTVQQYAKELPDVAIYVMGIPIGADFYLPEKVTKNIMREKNFLQHLYSAVGSNARLVHAYEKIEQHKAEYTYFNTDHHWTGRGAYYAYAAFGEAAGFQPLPLTSLVRKEIPNFLGTLYYRTLSPVLKNNADTVEYFKVPVETKVNYFYNNSSSGSTQLYAEYAKNGMAYGVFLGGDYPLVRIHSNVKNNKKIIVIKDSYGNAFAPYLASHYEDVFVVDYRYFNGNLKSLIDKEGIKELVFAHNTYVLSSGYTAQRANSFLMGAASKSSGTKSPVAAATPAPSASPAAPSTEATP
ncbi:MAG: hypothetical protein EBV20_07485 [Betaproteobacteria bacterium]|jgi:DHHW protein|nr:hypothetical protein [Betaproteobacteria bacterium]NBP44474.1 hypothetical protein [Betaproteobacteria bacterium]